MKNRKTNKSNSNLTNRKPFGLASASPIISDSPFFTHLSLRFAPQFS